MSCMIISIFQSYQTSDDCPAPNVHNRVSRAHMSRPTVDSQQCHDLHPTMYLDQGDGVRLYITYKVWGSVCSGRELGFIFIRRLNQTPGLCLNSEFKSFEMSFLFQRISRLPSFPFVCSKNCARLRGRVDSKCLHLSDSKDSAGREYNERLVPPIFLKTPPAWVRYAWPIIIANTLIMSVQLPNDTKDN